MTPAARIQAVIDILGELGKTNQPVDRHLRDWGRSHRFAGSKDRASIAERIYAIQRKRAWLGWRMGSDAPRALVIGSLLEEGNIEAVFVGAGYGPAALTDAEREIIASPRKEEPPLHVLGEYPAFLEEELKRSITTNPVIPEVAQRLSGTHRDMSQWVPGQRSLRELGRDDKLLFDEMTALQARAPADLRVNTLKTTREDLLGALRSEGYDAQPTPFSPVGIRLPEGEAKLGRGGLFLSGAFEFQDEAAQIAALLCGAKPGMRVLDLAAGAGGKSLALAALMRNSGKIVATDVRAAALHELERRAERAGATIIDTHPPDGMFDVVLLDAPCSGTGTWRRQPELRWRLTRERIEELKATQDTLLKQAALYVRPGGRLVYATCSILRSENEDRVAAFLESHRDFAIVPATDAWRESIPAEAPQNLGQFFRASPFSIQTDGFFTAILARNA
ncbi:MAG TPA: RsmB/NOP family class I SAM-dependent RNA methyltransferase [Rhizomicrobium sp.]|nr:RsmB/NOP family class I SAM-dependent RNA methyltransferase [Rhizomicrobium sp.]